MHGVRLCFFFKHIPINGVVTTAGNAAPARAIYAPPRIVLLLTQRRQELHTEMHRRVPRAVLAQGRVGLPRPLHCQICWWKQAYYGENGRNAAAATTTINGVQYTCVFKCSACLRARGKARRASECSRTRLYGYATIMLWLANSCCTTGRWCRAARASAPTLSQAPSTHCTSGLKLLYHQAGDQFLFPAQAESRLFAPLLSTLAF